MTHTPSSKQVAAAFRARIAAWMTPDDAKELLGLSGTNPTPKEVMQAYRRLSQEHHPDKGGDANKQVLFNAAKDMLTGKRVKVELKADPAAALRKEDIAAILRAKENVYWAADFARNNLSARTFAHKIDLREYITGEMADCCDEIQDAADEAAKNDLYTDAARERAKKISAAVKSVLATALRLATKYGSIVKGLDKSLDTVEEIEKAYGAFAKFVPALNEAFVESKKLNGLLTLGVGPNADDEHPIAFEVADRYFDSQGMLQAFVNDYGGLSERNLNDLQKHAQKDIGEVLGILQRYKAESSFPQSWKKWRIPDDFHGAVEAIRTGTPKQASARRVSERYRRAVL